MPLPSSILILGGTGQLGLPLLTSLATHPSRPSSLHLTTTIRPQPSSPHPPPFPQSLSHLTPHSKISLLPLDLPSTPLPTLTSTFRTNAYDLIISCTGMTFPSGTQTKIARAALDAGIPKYIPWQFGLDYDKVGRGSGQDLFDEQVAVRELLRGQRQGLKRGEGEGRGTEWMIVSTGVFMEFLFWEGWGVVEAQKKKSEQKGKGEDGEDGDGDRDGKGGYVVRALGNWDHRVTATGVEDIGRCVAGMVYDEDLEWNQVLFIAGDTLGFKELADVVERETGRDVKRELWDEEYLRKELEKEPGDGLRKYRVVFGSGKEGVSWEREGTWSEGKGLKLMGVEEWVRRNLKRV
ncbi:MAG: hypothetical protein Q9227_002101 [Pyrenula ochraceoflavens]